MLMRRWAKNNNRHQKTSSTQDPNLLYTLAACAGWGSRVMAACGVINRETLAFVLWVAGLEPNGTQVVLDHLLKKTDQERLLPEIKQAWDHPDEMASVIGAVHNGAPGSRTQRLAAEVAAQLQEWSEQRPRYARCRLAENLEETQRLFGLTDEELEFCFFLAVYKWWESAQNYFEHHLNCDEITGRSHLMRALDFNAETLGHVLGGKLHGIGILDFNRNYLQLEDEFLPFFANPDQVPGRQELFREVPAPELSSDQLGIDQDSLELLRALLSGPSKQPMHILMYGPPGTGKTSLARALCAELKMTGFEVLGQKDNRASSRRAALAACMEMAAGRDNSVVVVDEADQLLNTDMPWSHRGEVMDKGYLNGVLEQPALRGIWVVNEHDGIDAAVRRRFAFSLQLPPFNSDKRATMLESTLRRYGIKRHFSSDDIRTLAADFDLTPAIFATSVQVATQVQASPKGCRKALYQALVAQAQLQGKGRKGKIRSPRLSTGFLAEGLVTDRPLADIIRQVQSYDKNWRRSQNQVSSKAEPLFPLALLFHGLPGTGKTITAGHLAELIDRPLVSKRASDLLDPYLGMTERNLAGAFEAAANEGAVLVLDEVDTFLGVRNASRRTWEISMVNELLVQIEKHRGLVICTTNHLEGLDGAALRRFPLKVEFRCLKPNQAVTMYKVILGPRARGALSGALASRLRDMTPLTVADLMLVLRNHRMLGDGKLGHDQLVTELEREVALKPEARSTARTVGF